MTGGAGRKEMEDAMKTLKQMATDGVMYDVKTLTQAPTSIRMRKSKLLFALMGFL